MGGGRGDRTCETLPNDETLEEENAILSAKKLDLTAKRTYNGVKDGQMLISLVDLFISFELQGIRGY